MTELPIFDKNGFAMPYFLKALKQLMQKHEIKIVTATDKFSALQDVWLKEFNSTLATKDKEQHFTTIQFVNSADCLKFSLTFY